jgi:catechol 2,3-dioxygenase-like lactoylglutathione lyase family enzyme
MAITRVLPAILSDRVAESRDFYVNLLGFKVVFDTDWFVEVVSPTNSFAALGIWRRNHELVPKGFQFSPRGMVLSFQVDDVDAAHAAVMKRGHHIVQSLRNESYGQRHFMITDPDGLLLDITASIPMSEEFQTAHGIK